MPRFVILEHDHPFLHWDLMLESEESLRTWRLSLPPGESTSDIPAEPLPAHRLHYLDYEGPVSGNRGSVQRWDFGTFDWLREEEGRLELSLKGNRTSGLAVLHQTAQGWFFLTSGPQGEISDGSSCGDSREEDTPAHQPPTS